MSSLGQLKDALLQTDSIGAVQARGLILDYLPHSRELKQHLLGAVDTGVFQDLLNCNRVNNSTRKKYTQKFIRIAGDSVKGLILFNTILYLCGHLGSCPNTDYDSLSRSNFGISTVPKNSASPGLIVNSNPLAAIPGKHFRQLLLLVSLLVVFVFLLGILRSSDSYKSQEESRQAITNEETGYVIAPIQVTKPDFTPDMLPGRYIGTLTKNGTRRSFALFIRTLRNDSLFCTLKDYPRYDNPRVDFVLTMSNGKLYLPESGELYYYDGCISSGDDLNDQEVVKWEFNKLD